MISKKTPYKICEIIRDTWPGIYRKPKHNNRGKDNNGLLDCERQQKWENNISLW